MTGMISRPGSTRLSCAAVARKPARRNAAQTGHRSPVAQGNHTCRWTSLAAALGAFAEFDGRIQSERHILPLHWYVACRLVVEGGFDPDDIVPRPPFRVERRRRGPPVLHFDPSLGGCGEGTVLGGIRAKHVDVLVSLARIGPVLSVSCKGVTGAFRNLGNRIEEIVGDCTNLHMTHPALVIGHLVLIRGNRPAGRDCEPEEEELVALPRRGGGDAALASDGAPVPPVRRFHDALRLLGRRRDLLDQAGQCEAAALAMVAMERECRTRLVPGFPDEESGLHFDAFFAALYARYDERFVTRYPMINARTRRESWDPESPGLRLFGLDYRPNLPSALP